MKKILLSVLIILTYCLLPVKAENIDNYEYYQDNYFEENTIENGDTYCTPKKTIKEKLKNAFIGQPTGFTPQIQPSPYLNPNYGPSYMQGYYTGNTWNSHNSYNPIGAARIFGASF